MTKFISITVMVVLALCFCGITGAVVGAGRHDEGSGQSATGPVITQSKESTGQAKDTQASDGTTALLKDCIGLAKKGYEAAVESLQQTQRHGNDLVLIGQPEDVYGWSLRWLQAERAMSPKKSDQLAALQAHLQRMTELKKVVEALARVMLPNTAKLEAEWYLMEARLWFEQERAK